MECGGAAGRLTGRPAFNPRRLHRRGARLATLTGKPWQTRMAAALNLPASLARTGADGDASSAGWCFHFWYRARLAPFFGASRAPFFLGLPVSLAWRGAERGDARV
jgi:hypothetical protein